MYNITNLFSHPLRFKHFDVFTIRQNLLIEIELWTDTQREDAVFFVLFNFFLGIMERQGTKVISLTRRNLQLDLFRLTLGTGYDAVVVVEEVLGIEVLGHREHLAVELADVEDAVESVNHDAFEVRAESNQIPTLLEEFHAVGMDVESETLVAPIALVGSLP